jgi:hypothetical protein
VIVLAFAVRADPICSAENRECAVQPDIGWRSWGVNAGALTGWGSIEGGSGVYAKSARSMSAAWSCRSSTKFSGKRLRPTNRGSCVERLSRLCLSGLGALLPSSRPTWSSVTPFRHCGVTEDSYSCRISLFLPFGGLLGLAPRLIKLDKPLVSAVHVIPVWNVHPSFPLQHALISFH